MAADKACIREGGAGAGTNLRGDEMYINPFWAGVLATILAEIMLFIGMVIITTWKNSKT